MKEYNNDQFSSDEKSLKDYLILIRTNILPILLIALTGLIVSIIYATNAIDIYSSTTAIKIAKPSGSILSSPLMPEFNDWGSDRFIANEIEILKSYTLREKIAQRIINEVEAGNVNIDELSKVLDNQAFLTGSEKTLLNQTQITGVLALVGIEQKRGLDIVEISFESPSPEEAAWIPNIYTQAYSDLNLEFNREQVNNVKSFLEEQRTEKLDDLVQAENDLKNYQELGQIFSLDNQAQQLIDQLSEFESKKYENELEYNISTQRLEAYRKELNERNPSLSKYIEKFASEPRLKALQTEIVSLESRRDLALANTNLASEKDKLLSDYNARIASLRSKLDEQLEIYKSSVFATTPEELKDLSLKIFEEDVKNSTLEAALIQLKKIVADYEAELDQLPERTLDLARLERNRVVLEKLYLLVEEKYQEALINEQSTPGNVQVIDRAIVPANPSKPNRQMIILVGLVLGIGLGFAFAFVKEYFDNSIKTPDEIQNRNIPVLAWVPQIDGLSDDKEKYFEFIVSRKPDSIPSEAFRALRTRILFSKVDSDSINTILITSSAPREGKTVVSVNLAGSFAQANKKTVLLDCDLRKPRVHSVFKDPRLPGFTDYIFGQNTFEEILRETELENMYYISAGTIPPNPSEILASHHMTNFLAKLREEFDMIVLDSPPVIAVTDAEILSRVADATILVVSANSTEMEMMQKSVDLLKHEHGSFTGTVLNNFSYRSGYGSYYKYYYYYSKKDPRDKSTN